MCFPVWRIDEDTHSESAISRIEKSLKEASAQVSCISSSGMLVEINDCLWLLPLISQQREVMSLVTTDCNQRRPWILLKIGECEEQMTQETWWAYIQSVQYFFEKINMRWSTIIFFITEDEKNMYIIRSNNNIDIITEVHRCVTTFNNCSPSVNYSYHLKGNCWWATIVLLCLVAKFVPALACLSS